MSGPPPAPSAHFLNNVLAAAASYVDEDPDLARDVLAELGQFLAYRLRADLEPVPLAEELSFVRSYLQLEAWRFPDRLAVEVDDRDALASVRPLSVQEPLQDALSERLGTSPAGLRVLVRADGAGARWDFADVPA